MNAGQHVRRCTARQWTMLCLSGALPPQAAISCQLFLGWWVGLYELLPLPMWQFWLERSCTGLVQAITATMCSYVWQPCGFWQILFAVNVHYLWFLWYFCSLFLDGIIPVHKCDLCWNLLNRIGSRIKLASKEKAQAVLILLFQTLEGNLLPGENKKTIGDLQIFFA